MFYDWGLDSYHSSVKSGALSDGINENIADCYWFIVQNYNPGAELYFFRFSKGAYTVGSLSGLIYNCEILKRSYTNRIHQACDLCKF